MPLVAAITSKSAYCKRRVSAGARIRDSSAERDRRVLGRCIDMYRRQDVLSGGLPGTPVTGSGRSTPQAPGLELSFKRRKSFNSRKRDVEEITKKHPHKIPIVIERGKNEKFLPLLDKSKFLVPEELTMSQLTTIIRRRLQLMDTQAFYMVVNRRTMVNPSLTLAEVYRTEKDSDGFLYITYASQEMFG